MNDYSLMQGCGGIGGTSGQQYAQTNEPKRLLAIHAQVEALGKAITVHEGLLAALTDRLNPIMSLPDNKKDTGVPPRPPSAPFLADVLGDYVSGITRLSRLVGLVIGRLEI